MPVCSSFSNLPAFAYSSVQMTFATNATLFNLSVWYTGTDCDGTPYRIFISEPTTCNSDGYCLANSTTGSGYLRSRKTVCTIDLMQSIKEIFSDSPYLLKLSCNDLRIGEVFITSGNCEGPQGFAIATLDTNGSASLEIFSDSACSKADESYSIGRDTLNSHECDDNHYKWYSSGVDTANWLIQGTHNGTFRSVAPIIESSPVHSELSTVDIIGIGVGCVMVFILIFQAILCCRQRTVGRSFESHLHPLARLNSMQGAVYIQHREATGL